MNKIKTAAIYARISIDERNDISINNQVDSLKQYAAKNNINIYGVFIDNGFTGTNFKRPGFCKMYEEIKKGKINTVLIKDLSRLGRDYLETGYFIEKVFPNYGVSVISINDKLDTSLPYESIMVAVKNIINEYYALDISRKIKFTLNEQMKEVKYHPKSRPPYGYLNKKEGRVIDKEKAKIVRRIYSLFLNGVDAYHIAKLLNNEEILSPSGRLKKWSSKTILNILSYEEYTGYYIRHKKEKLFRQYKCICVANSNQYKRKDDTLIIIDNKTFKKVGLILEK